MSDWLQTIVTLCIGAGLSLVIQWFAQKASFEFQVRENDRQVRLDKIVRIIEIAKAAESNWMVVFMRMVQISASGGKVPDFSQDERIPMPEFASLILCYAREMRSELEEYQRATSRFMENIPFLVEPNTAAKYMRIEARNSEEALTDMATCIPLIRQCLGNIQLEAQKIVDNELLPANG